MREKKSKERRNGEKERVSVFLQLFSFQEGGREGVDFCELLIHAYKSSTKT